MTLIWKPDLHPSIAGLRPCIRHKAFPTASLPFYKILRSCPLHLELWLWFPKHRNTNLSLFLHALDAFAAGDASALMASLHYC